MTDQDRLLRAVRENTEALPEPGTEELTDDQEELAVRVRRLAAYSGVWPNAADRVAGQICAETRLTRDDLTDLATSAGVDLPQDD